MDDLRIREVWIVRVFVEVLYAAAERRVLICYRYREVTVLRRDFHRVYGWRGLRRTIRVGVGLLCNVVHAADDVRQALVQLWVFFPDRG